MYTQLGIAVEYYNISKALNWTIRDTNRFKLNIKTRNNVLLPNKAQERTVKFTIDKRTDVAFEFKKDLSTLLFICVFREVRSTGLGTFAYENSAAWW